MAAVRVADLISELLVEHGIRHVFMLTGGGAMHLNDALGRAAGLTKVFTHHEQAAAIAAESYARLSGVPAAVNVTTGPGGVNALNGVYGAYVDSIPMVVVSGQVKRETIAANYPLPLRQLGDQEVDIVSMVRGITKYAVVLQNAKDTLKVVGKALHLAVRGRPGPVWIDIPIDIQGSLVDRAELEPFDPEARGDRLGEANNTAAEEQGSTGPALSIELCAMFTELCAAERPLVLAGAGIRLSGMHAQFLALVERLGVPVVTGWNAHDVIPNDHPLFVGRPGTVGDRGGNFAVQTADYLLVLGSRLNIRQVSYNWQSFAKNARVAMIDIDQAELNKPTLRLHRAIHADLCEALPVLLSLDLPATNRTADRQKFLAHSRDLAQRYPAVEPRYWEKSAPINPYCFGEALFDALEEGDIIVTADGTACVTIFQSARIKPGQRLYTNSGCASMGYDLPAAIGAAHAAGGKRIICLAGDGSIMMNLQELQTIVGNRLPIKIFLLNNDGYHSIRQTQQNYFSDNIVGCGPDSGLSFPDFQRLAAAFGFPTNLASDHANLRSTIAAALQADGPFFSEIMLDKAQEFAPKLASRRLPDGRMVSPELEDMAPFLPREELSSVMTIAREQA